MTPRAKEAGVMRTTCCLSAPSHWATSPKNTTYFRPIPSFQYCKSFIHSVFTFGHKYVKLKVKIAITPITHWLNTFCFYSIMVAYYVVLLEWDFTTTLFSELVICWKQLSVAKSWFRHLTKKTLKAFWASTQTHWVLVEQLLVPLKCRAARQLAEETTAYPCSRGKNLPTGI